ncbi:sodium-coupled monocarboxylate transporter 1-like [Penaeus japonicus]|uniref:sodium-coupled monocarboxylate transporter 1-like n=1 Tax=Penaeus japonicus TaxID=27405 RepID=UPI001C70DFDD|nr:sodium-coupled monocarboxylate transporter 1-like [Penaeus japonicus]
MSNEVHKSSTIVANFSVVDYAILTILFLASILLGTVAGWRSNKSSTKDFLTGGRNMNPVAVTLSLLGGVVSALSVLGNSTEIYLHGTQLWMNLIGGFWGTAVVVFLLLPIFYPLGLSSLNEYLEMRFKTSLLKRLASSTQILNSALYMGICLFAPSLTLSSVTSLPLWFSIVTLGGICSICISLGGVRAVVYTDVLQTTTMFLGVLVVVVQVCTELGGVGEVWRRAERGGRFEFFNLDPSPLVRHTFWSVQVLGAYFVVSIIGISQAQYQRLVSVRSLKISQGMCFAFMLGLTVLWSLFYLAGLVAYAVYQDCDPVSSGQVKKPDEILGFLVADKLRHFPGMTGLFVAAVAGAVLSSLSSLANSLVVMIWEDFLSGWSIFSGMSPTRTKVITRVMSSCMGLVSIVMALLVANLGTLFQTAYTISGALVSPMDGLFLTAVLAPWVNTKGIISGFVASLVFNIILMLGKFLYGAGNSEDLPLSTAGCPTDTPLLENGWNATSISSNRYVAGRLEAESSYPRLFDVSYCYVGVIGILSVLVVSTIVSVCTGVTDPDEIDDRLVNKTCLAFYRYLLSGRQTNAKGRRQRSESIDKRSSDCIRKPLSVDASNA